MAGTWGMLRLLAPAGESAPKLPEVELEPLEPGAWAGWARERGLRARAADAARNSAAAPARLDWTSATARRFAHR
jgi:hypothetical protein